MALFQPGCEHLVTHGQSKTPVYRIWSAMRRRCNNPNCVAYSELAIARKHVPISTNALPITPTQNRETYPNQGSSRTHLVLDMLATGYRPIWL